MGKQNKRQELLNDTIDLLEEMKGDQSLMEWIAIHHYREIETIIKRYNKLDMNSAKDIIKKLKETWDKEEWLYAFDAHGTKESAERSEYAQEDYGKIRSTFNSDVEVVHEDREGIDKDQKVIVWHFKDPDVYIRMQGYYGSYYGTEMDTSTLEEVKPVPQTIINYVPTEDALERKEEDNISSYGSY